MIMIFPYSLLHLCNWAERVSFVHQQVGIYFRTVFANADQTSWNHPWPHHPTSHCCLSWSFTTTCNSTATQRHSPPQTSAKETYKALRVLITGAAGNIGYATAFLVAEGVVFGPHQKVILHLLEIEPAKKALEGLQLNCNVSSHLQAFGWSLMMVLSPCWRESLLPPTKWLLSKELMLSLWWVLSQEAKVTSTLLSVFPTYWSRYGEKRLVAKECGHFQVPRSFDWAVRV